MTIKNVTFDVRYNGPVKDFQAFRTRIVEKFKPKKDTVFKVVASIII